jgi:hypothetical protein
LLTLKAWGVGHPSPVKNTRLDSILLELLGQYPIRNGLAVKVAPRGFGHGDQPLEDGRRGEPAVLHGHSGGVEYLLEVGQEKESEAGVGLLACLD